MAKEAQYVQEGRHIDYTPSGADVAAGQVVPLTLFCGIADDIILDGELGALSIAGVYDFAADTAEVMAVGTLAYWDNADNTATLTTTSNTKLGMVIKAKGSGETTVRVAVGLGI